MRVSSLPHLDEHATVVTAGADAVWRSVSTTLDRSFTRPGAAVYARLVGCADSSASGPRPLAQGSTVPGFRVAATTPGRELVLEGRHHFSTYAVVFRLDPVPDSEPATAAGPAHDGEAAPAVRYRLRAESRAVFPGPLGKLYRALVVGTGIHVRVMRRMLASIRHRAEAGTGDGAGPGEAPNRR